MAVHLSTAIDEEFTQFFCIDGPSWFQIYGDILSTLDVLRISGSATISFVRKGVWMCSDKRQMIAVLYIMSV